MGFRNQPCEWPLADIACQTLDELDDYTLRDTVVDTATSLLWNWTGRKYGLCETTIRPCRTDCVPSTYEGWSGTPSTWNNMFFPVLIDGDWFNLRCGRRCKDNCGCSYTNEISLPLGVHDIVEVIIDGVPVNPSAYRVDNYRWLVRTDGGDWPTCQDLNLPAGDPNTWTVTYRYGTEVPSGGQVAAALLSCEMAKNILGRDCELPQRIQSVSREGITVGIVDSFQDLEAGRTGIWLVDSWVTSVMNAPTRSRVITPNMRTPRVQT